MLTSRCVYDLCFASYVTLYCFLGCIIFCSVVIIQLLVQFTCTCMLNTNHCHRTPIPGIPTAQTIDGDVMCQSSDNQLVPPSWSGWGRSRGLMYGSRAWLSYLGTSHCAANGRLSDRIFVWVSCVDVIVLHCCDFLGDL